ncbi:malto-oligosyltrehalose synthase [Candidatus Nitrosoglobus terrae]|uniref:Malto-oligosyltrehalose synthase n=1 Tax=Candidatus Nitrosoglobus terrae TaxID=1630141 RepID=A0A1Q2SMV3_9GAMM|nr:malto-oligosyltrehalose synthase [Candidatus Nitrosoglobus terrae]
MFNPEIGSWDSFNAFAQCLHHHGMGQIMDIVPNHMGIGGNDNIWWLDILEHGLASEYAVYFDIDWQPVKEELRGKVLLPLLGDYYGVVIENGELQLDFNPSLGQFNIRFYNHQLPIDPKTYPYILERRLDQLAEYLTEDKASFLEYQSLITAFKHLPSRDDIHSEKRAERLRDSAIYKRRLAEFCQQHPLISTFIHDIIITLNGKVGQPKSFDLLHHLLENQAYRLAYWRVAADEINYRRFFDINELAGLRMENPEVFTATHRFILDLIKSRKIDGIRVDHPDGLYDPARYYQRLNQLIIEIENEASHKVSNEISKASYYIVIEKILANYEHLPESWPICGTTGYEFAHINNGLFVYPSSQKEFKQIYTRFIRHPLDFDELLYKCKKTIIQTQLSSELTVLTNMLDNIAQSDRHTRDFTLNGLREALTELLACFPVYRTYMDINQVSEEDKRFVQWAVAQAKKRSPATDISVFDFIQSILLRLETPTGLDIYREVIPFVMRFQQYTGPVMAKALEDTALYIYNCLISLNDVGSDPRSFGVSLAAFHRANQERGQRWPYGMLSSSTHDSKRNEDIRARLNVLSEMPDKWRKYLNRWARINRSKVQNLNGVRAPSRNDEYLFYQTVLGAWPLLEMDTKRLANFRSRIEIYMIKAIREAKIHTSWINPDAEYETAIISFIQSVLGNIEKNPFLADFLPFQRYIAQFGLLNSLSQTLLKLTAPGVPDIYQGNELWEFRFVDPDSRSSVDFSLRQQLLQELTSLTSTDQPLKLCAYELLKNKEDGRVKLYLIWRVLNLRAKLPLLFQEGSYLPLPVQGIKADHLCVFARKYQREMMISIAPRWLSLLGSDENKLPLGDSCWGETWIEVPEIEENQYFINILTDEIINITHYHGKHCIFAAKIFTSFSVALLVPSSFKLN